MLALFLTAHLQPQHVSRLQMLQTRKNEISVSLRVLCLVYDSEERSDHRRDATADTTSSLVNNLIGVPIVL